MQYMDSLDPAYQLYFTRRLAIEFAIVDGCYKMEWDSNRGVRRVRTAGGGGRLDSERRGHGKEVSRTICRCGVTSQFLESQDVCRDCCCVRDDRFMHDTECEGNVQSSTSSARHASNLMPWKKGTE